MDGHLRSVKANAVTVFVISMLLIVIVIAGMKYSDKGNNLTSLTGAAVSYTDVSWDRDDSYDFSKKKLFDETHSPANEYPDIGFQSASSSCSIRGNTGNVLLPLSNAAIYRAGASEPDCPNVDSSKYSTTTTSVCFINNDYGCIKDSANNYYLIKIGVIDSSSGTLSWKKFPIAETSCTDGVDNDGDGLTDCSDPTCAADAACCNANGTSKYDNLCNSGCGVSNACNGLAPNTQLANCKLAGNPGIYDKCNSTCQVVDRTDSYLCSRLTAYGELVCSADLACVMKSPGSCASNWDSATSSFVLTGKICSTSDCTETSVGVPTEICDGVDNDCDGVVDEGVKITYYKDADGDGYGDTSVTIQACAASSGYVSDSSDCNDANANIHPGAAELCDGIDNNCNGTKDEGCACTPSGKNQTCGSDIGECRKGNQTCLPTGAWGVCVGEVKPTTEICNGKDDDCDDEVDEDVKIMYYKDADSDGYGIPEDTEQACTTPSGYAKKSPDCDDANPAVNPGATEVCIDSIDNNCNGLIDSSEEGCGQQITGGSGGGGTTIINKTIIGEIAPTFTIGDGICDIGETPLNSPMDCGCSAGQQLVGARCVAVVEEEVAVCGDDFAENTEVCDGTDDSQCPGACDADCTCPFFVNDGICSKEAGESKNNSPEDCRFKLPGFLQLGLIFALFISGIGGAWWLQERKRERLEDLSAAHGADAPLSVPPEEVSNTIESYINNTLSEGFSPEDIRATLVSKGWDVDTVDKKLRAAAKDIKFLNAATEVYKVKEPHEDLKKLEKYINYTLREGYNPVQVKTALTSAGWDEKTVEKVFAKHEKIDTDLKNLTKTHKVHKPAHENEDNIKDFVKAGLRAGHTPKRVKKALHDVGWTVDAIAKHTKI